MTVSFRSDQAASARWYNGSREYVSTGWAVLVRLQQALRARQWTHTDRTSAYRDGGPIGRPNTAFAPLTIRQDANYGAVTSAALWLATAEILLPGASLEDLYTGRALQNNAGVRNVLDKIEQSYVERRMHPTALEAALLVIHHARGETTGAEFMARRGPRLPPDVDRAAVAGWPVRGEALSAPRGLLARMIYPRDAPITRAVYLATLRGCSALGEQVQTGTLQAHFARGLAQLGEAVGSAPRITRTHAEVVASCSERFTAAWPVRVDVPQLEGLNERVDYEFARALEGGFAVGLEVGAVPFRPELHGALSWWESGLAARSQTRDDTNVLAPSENPLGPDALRPSTSIRDVGAVLAYDVAPLVVAGVAIVGGAWWLSRR